MLTSDELEGHPVVLNIWASWCIPCKEEAPLLERAWRDYRDEGVMFVGVNIKDSSSDATEFVERFGITYPIVRDESEELARKLGVFAITEPFFVDHEWRFLASVAGGEQAERQGTVALRAISGIQLFDNLELLVPAVATAGAGVIHLSVTQEHLEEYWLAPHGQPRPPPPLRLVLGLRVKSKPRFGTLEPPHPSPAAMRHCGASSASSRVLLFARAVRISSTRRRRRARAGLARCFPVRAARAGQGESDRVWKQVRGVSEAPRRRRRGA